MEKSQHKLEFIVFSDDWGVHPSSCQHIFRHIIPEHPVFWVNTVGMRPPKLALSDARKVVEKVSRMFHSATDKGSEKTKAPTVIQPPMMPYMSNSLCRRFNRYSVLRSIRTALPENSSARRVIVTTVPNVADYIEGLDAGLVIYYCVDDFSDWPGHDKDLILAMEEQLLGSVDLIFATSSNLHDRLSRTGKPTEMLAHGVDVEHFAERTDRVHPTLENIPAPRVGFFGLIDGRLDQDLVWRLSKQRPDVSFVFAGPVDVSTRLLEDATNVHLVGPVPYDELPHLVNGLDALVMPYKVNELSESLSPLKLKEYLATGKPIITSSIAAVADYRDYVCVGASETEWLSCIGTALLQDSSGGRINLDNESWQAKARQLEVACV